MLGNATLDQQAAVNTKEQFGERIGRPISYEKLVRRLGVEFLPR